MKYNDYKKKLKKEYKNTFKIKKHVFKLRYLFIAITSVLIIALIVEHLFILGYNRDVREYNTNIKEQKIELNAAVEFVKVNNNKEYEQIISGNKYKTEKVSILSNIFSLQFISCSSSKSDSDLGIDDAVMSPPGDSNSAFGESNSFSTNVQVAGIDEADTSKCDGKYIYYLYDGVLYVYSIETNKNICEMESNAKELYIYKNKVVTLGKETSIFSFDGKSLHNLVTIKDSTYVNSRLIDNICYIILRSSNKSAKIDYNDCYYNNSINPNYLYTLYKYNLDDLEYTQAQLLTSSNTILYVSTNNFYFASYNINHNYTAISMFSDELEALGIIQVKGSILNQFSMDEYDNYFRIVSTDNTRNAEELNSITIFDLNEFKRVGYLDNGIGIARQIVKSVRFDKGKCYIVTYDNTDPLYEIDCSNPNNPVIVSSYKAPGYSNYLHTFVIDNREYVLGLGYTDYSNLKISIYINGENETTQVGKDYVLSKSEYYEKGDYYNSKFNLEAFDNHKALFIYNDNTNLYIGAKVTFDCYIIFKIDVKEENVVKIYKEIEIENDETDNSRAYLVENNIYIINLNEIVLNEFYN